MKTQQQIKDSLDSIASQTAGGKQEIESFLLALDSADYHPSDFDGLLDQVSPSIREDLMCEIFLNGFIVIKRTGTMALKPLHDYVEAMMAPHEYPRMGL